MWSWIQHFQSGNTILRPESRKWRESYLNSLVASHLTWKITYVVRYQTRGKLNMRNIIILDNLFVMVLFVENHLNICYQIVHIYNAKFLCNIEIPWFYLRERLLESLGIIRPLLIHIILKKYENEKSFKYSLSVSMYCTVLYCI